MGVPKIQKLFLNLLRIENITTFGAMKTHVSNIHEICQLTAKCEAIRLERGKLFMPLPFVRNNPPSPKVNRDTYIPSNFKLFDLCGSILFVSILNPGKGLVPREDIEFYMRHLYMDYFINSHATRHDLQVVDDFINCQFRRMSYYGGWYGYVKHIKETHPECVVNRDRFTCNVNVCHISGEDAPLVRRKIAMEVKMEAKRSLMFKFVFSLKDEEIDYFFVKSSRNQNSVNKGRKMAYGKSGEFFGRFNKERKRCGIKEVKIRMCWDYLKGLLLELGLESHDYDGLCDILRKCRNYIYCDLGDGIEDFVDRMCKGILASYPFRKLKSIFVGLCEKIKPAEAIIENYINIVSFKEVKNYGFSYKWYEKT